MKKYKKYLLEMSWLLVLLPFSAGALETSTPVAPDAVEHFLAHQRPGPDDREVWMIGTDIDADWENEILLTLPSLHDPHKGHRWSVYKIERETAVPLEGHLWADPQRIFVGEVAAFGLPNAMVVFRPRPGGGAFIHYAIEGRAVRERVLYDGPVTGDKERLRQLLFEQSGPPTMEPVPFSVFPELGIEVTGLRTDPMEPSPSSRLPGTQMPVVSEPKSEAGRPRWILVVLAGAVVAALAVWVYRARS
jgi:hypothetical protein